MLTTKKILQKAEWGSLLSQMKAFVPETFEKDFEPLNLMMGSWQNAGNKKPFNSSIDGSLLGHYPNIDLETCKTAVAHASQEAKEWANTDLPTRKAAVQQTIDDLEKHKELIAYLLVWEIGKPFDQSLDSVERCIMGVQWYIDNIEEMLGSRAPIGVVSNIASWNYPISVLVHACLVQMLCGNAAVAKTPSDGGLFSLTISFAFAKRNGLPITLVSGSGGALSDALVKNEHVDCLAYVGGKSNGRNIVASLVDKNKRYMLEMEGVNAYGVWNYSDWDHLAKQLKSGFKYGKQRCTAYVRFVVQRTLFPEFLEMYLSMLKSISYGHPLLVENGSDEPPKVDFGPLINSKKAEEVDAMYHDAISKGAVCLYRGTIDAANFLPNQDISAYYPPSALLNVPKNALLYHNEPFGPLDSIILVDTEEELISEMNISNGSLVSSIACDDLDEAKRIASQLRGYKVGINKSRSRGDKEESFGGIGESWKGCFVGGKYLVEAVTKGEEGERLMGNFSDYTLAPAIR
ncbi:MAG: aldehyde dehydrogenase family protein [Cyclobacteriaceae bacterium]|nr:aldehyde dehydrogenase family protein [Cyclobacteriaceae bacterium]MCH8515884.1 aldehyde dehydrogenase family protein [Cyclobacteriaceae bacterium]